MTTDKEQEAFGLVIERHKTGASENDIRAAFQRFMETAGVATLDETTTEGPPGIGNPGRMDLYVHNTCIEFKKEIVRVGTPVHDYVAQLDGYLESLLKAGTGVRNGILTDSIHYFLRRVGEEKLPLQQHPVMHIFELLRYELLVRNSSTEQRPHPHSGCAASIKEIGQVEPFPIEFQEGKGFRPAQEPCVPKAKNGIGGEG